MKLCKLTSRQDLEKVYPLIKELRTDLSFDSFMMLHDNAKKADGYTIIAASEDGQFTGAMGYRVLYDFVHGKHLYIDDLVVTHGARSKGLGKTLLEHANEIALAEGCSRLRLCTGSENERGIQFYQRENWVPRAIAFKKLVEASQIT